MKQVEIKSVSVVSAAKVFLYAGIAFSILRIVTNVWSYLHGTSSSFCGACTVNFSIGFPLGLAVLAAVLAFAYNRIAGRFGGIKMTVEDADKD